MKKITLVLFLLFTVCLTANAQFTLTRNGLVSTDNPEQRYIVLGFEGKTQQELFQIVNVYFHTLYSNPRKTFNVIENQVISMELMTQEAFFMRKTMQTELYYTISLEFKDGRIKVNAPTNLRLFWLGTENKKIEVFLEGDKRLLHYVDGIFDVRGTITYPKTKQSIEDYFNNFVFGLLNAVKENSDW